MPESPIASELRAWNVPQCPFSIEYAPRALDDIRLAVMDAFFSLPRGGAEIGGILLGEFTGGRLTISDYVALDCEHAFGPSFTLSPHDEARLQELLTAARAGALAPVGWYHSHTRSEIFLSEPDLKIHSQFFPEPWQVALVLKPHTFQPMRAGFFFREAGGNIQADATYREFTLDPLPVRAVPSGDLPVPEQPVALNGHDPERPTVTIETSAISATSVPDTPAIAASAAAVAPAMDPEPEPPATEPEVAVPAFAAAQAEPRSAGLRRFVVVFAVTVGAAVIGFGTRQFWLPRVQPILHSAPAPAAAPAPAFASIGLSTIDVDGQLQIHWDRYAAAVRQATAGRLTIADGAAAPREFPLDPAVLQTGNFTYARQGESVNVTLTLDEPQGKPVHELSTFIGKLPKPRPAADDSAVRKQRDAAITDAAKLKQTLQIEIERNRRLQKSLEDAKKEVARQQQKRLANQLPAK